MTVRLRPHHLLCVLTYVGEGYTPAFVENYDALVVRLNAGEEVLIVEGPDDVCRPLLAQTEPHCKNADVLERDRKAERSLAALLSRPIEVGQGLVLTAPLLDQMRDAFRVGATRQACVGCEWSSLCASVAACGFDRARLRPVSTT